ncbi:MAG: caspase family protein, partial [Bacteroidetes bacterium]
MSKERIIGTFGARPEKENTGLRTNHLWIIGIDIYEDPDIPNLDHPVREVQDFRDLMLSDFQFEEKNVRFLLNENATKSGILNGFDHYLSTLTDADNLLLYFAGHGTLHTPTKRGYWLTHESRKTDRSTFLNNSEVVDFFKNCRAHHIFGIVDSCFSGALFQTRNLAESDKRIDRFPSRWLLTAGRNEPVLDESPFAKAVLTFLKNEPAKAIWAADLCTHVMKV